MSGFTISYYSLPYRLYGRLYRMPPEKKFQIRFLLFVLYLHYFDDNEPSYFKFFRTGENFKFKNETVLMLF